MLREVGMTGGGREMASRMAQFMNHRTREIGEETFVTFMTYHAKVRKEQGKIVTYSMYLALGVDFEASPCSTSP
uniref:hypothetical protein n=1 Tax=Sulfodiicoccus acidiphilus TaxID=1670455 RepID=UPI000F8403FF|nr:hypothetical protein [Sulfodiicoccus acidiphilus]